MIQNRFSTLTKLVTISVMLFGISALPVFADFNPNELIPDTSFNDTQTFANAAGIQQFLTNNNSILANTTNTFLLMLKEPSDPKLKTALNDPEPNLSQLRTAAQLIWDISQETGINPQVVLVTLQKEQGLITSTYTTSASEQKALDHALGFNCTDSNGCDQVFSGFYFQLFGNLDSQGNRYIGAPASLMRSFNTPGGRGPNVDANGYTYTGLAVRTSHVGDVINVQNTLGGPENPQPVQLVTLTNSATAALYRYTPHVYNGNYNFWKFFTTWFQYPNGTIFTVTGSPTVYIINNGAVSQMLNFVLKTRGLDPNNLNVVSLSPQEFSNYAVGPVFAPTDDTIVEMNTDPNKQLYVFQSGVEHPVSSFVLQQRGLSSANALSISQTEFNSFQTGSLLTPTDGTLISGSTSKTIFVIQNGMKMALTPLTFKQYGYSFKNVVSLPQTEVDQYAAGGFVLPKNGTLLTIGTGQEVYQINDQILQPVSYTVFQLNGYKFSDVVQVNADQLVSTTVGQFLTPPENTYFQVEETGLYYQYSNGAKHLISPFVLSQRKIAPLAVTLGLEEGLDISDGQPLPPKDGTIIEGSTSPALYAIVSGQKVALTYALWVGQYKKQAPSVLPQSEVDSYPDQNSDTIQQ